MRHSLLYKKLPSDVVLGVSWGFEVIAMANNCFSTSSWQTARLQGTKHIIIYTCIEVLYKNQVLYPVIWHAELRVFIEFALCGWCVHIQLLSLQRIQSHVGRVVAIFGRSGPFSSWQQACGFCDDNSHMVALKVCPSLEVESYITALHLISWP